MRTIYSANLSHKVTHRTGRPSQVWGTCTVTSHVPGIGAIAEPKIVCCNGDGTGWLYDIAEEAMGRDDLDFHEAIDKDSEEVVMVVGQPDEEASDMLCE